MLHSDLFAFLQDTSEINDLFDGRIFHENQPQSVKETPTLVFFLTSTTEQAEDMEEPGNEKIDLANYQFDIYGRKSKEVVDAADSFDSVFRNFTGTMGSTRVQRIALGNISHLGEFVGDKQVRRVSLDYSIWHDA